MEVNIRDYYTEHYNIADNPIFGMDPNLVFDNPDFDWLKVFYHAQYYFYKQDKPCLIFFPAGTYYFSRTIQVFTNGKLRGEGKNNTFICFKWSLDTILPEIAEYGGNTPYYKWLDGIVFHSGGAGAAGAGSYNTGNLPAPYLMAVPLPTNLSFSINEYISFNQVKSSGTGLTVEKLCLEFQNKGNVNIPEYTSTILETIAQPLGITIPDGLAEIPLKYPYYGHGINAHGVVSIHHCAIKGFLGDGIHISSTTMGTSAFLEQYLHLFDEHGLPIPSTTDNNPGYIPLQAPGGFLSPTNVLTLPTGIPIPGSNACGCIVTYTNINNCSGHGIFTLGGDANTCQFIGMMLNNCGGWGILEAGSLGNIYIGCNIHGCASGSVKAIAPLSAGYYRYIDNSSSFINCHTDGEVILIHGQGKQQWFGGIAHLEPGQDALGSSGYTLPHSIQMSKKNGLRFFNAQKAEGTPDDIPPSGHISISFAHIEPNRLLDFGGWVLAHRPDDASFKFIQSSAAASDYHALSLSNYHADIPKGNVWFPKRFYLSRPSPDPEQDYLHNGVTTNAGIPNGYFPINYPPEIGFGGTDYTHYHHRRFPKTGDIVFNEDAKPGELNGTKKGYIGYMCIQDGIPETEMIQNSNGEWVEYIKSEAGHPKMTQISIWKAFGRLLTVLLFFLFSQISFGQGFLRAYPNNNIDWWEANIIRGIIPQDDNTYLACTGEDTLQFWSFDLQGRVFAKKNLQTPENISCDLRGFIPTSDGNYLLRGNDCTTKVTPQGDSIWYKPITTNWAIRHSLPNGNFVAVTSGTLICSTGDITFCFYMALYDSQATHIADTTWLVPVETAPHCWDTMTRGASVANNESVTIAGWRYDYMNTPYIDVAKVSLDNFGEVLWRTVGPVGVSFDIAGLSDGSYLLAAGVGTSFGLESGTADSIRIIKYSTNGNIVWQRNIEIEQSYPDIYNAYFLKITNDNEFILAVNETNYIIGIDSLGNKLWQKNVNIEDILYNLYGDPGFSGNFNARISLREDNTYLISGGYVGSGNQSVFFFAHIDSTGSCRPQAAFTLEQTDSLVSLSNSSFGADSYTWLWGNGANLSDTTGLAQQYIYPQTGSYNLCLVAHNLCGNDTLCQTINYFAAGINRPTSNPLQVFPNPAGEQLYATFPTLSASAVWRLYDSAGRVVLSQNLSAGSLQVRYPTSTLPLGVYVLELRSADWSAWQKVVVAR
jgi:PKD repeat protein